MGIKGEMSGTVCVPFTWYMYIYELFITPVKLVTYYLFDIRGAKQSLPNK